MSAFYLIPKFGRSSLVDILPVNNPLLNRSLIWKTTGKTISEVPIISKVIITSLLRQNQRHLLAVEKSGEHDKPRKKQTLAP